jgi:hypothetical protein
MSYITVSIVEVDGAVYALTESGVYLIGTYERPPVR